MIIMHESVAAHVTDKPMICPKCERGKLGNIPGGSDAPLSRRGRPPPDEHGEYVQIKCHICHSLWALTIKS